MIIVLRCHLFFIILEDNWLMINAKLLHAHKMNNIQNPKIILRCTEKEKWLWNEAAWHTNFESASFKDMKLQILCIAATISYIFFFFKSVFKWSIFDTSNSINCHCYNDMLFFMMKWMCNMMFVFHRIIISWIYISFYSFKNIKIYEYSSGNNCEALV